jgi:hypothetical protein
VLAAETYVECHAAAPVVKKRLHAYLGWNVRIEVTCIFRTDKFRAVGRRITVNVLPIDTLEPGMRLHGVRRRQLRRELPENGYTILTLMRWTPSLSVGFPG